MWQRGTSRVGSLAPRKGLNPWVTRVLAAGGGAVPVGTAVYFAKRRTVLAEENARDESPKKQEPEREVWEEERETLLRPYIRPARQQLQEWDKCVEEQAAKIKKQIEVLKTNPTIKVVDDCAKNTYIWVRDKPAAGVILGLGIITPFLLRKVTGFKVAALLSLVGTPVALQVYHPEVLGGLWKSVSDQAQSSYKEAKSKVSGKAKEEPTKQQQAKSGQAPSALTNKGDRVKHVEIKDTAADKATKVKDAAADVEDKAAAKVDEIKNAAHEKAKELKDTAADLRDKAASKANEAKDAAHEKAKEVKDTAAEAKDKAAGKLSEAKDAVGSKEVKDATLEKAEDIKDAGKVKA